MWVSETRFSAMDQPALVYSIHGVRRTKHTLPCLIDTGPWEWEISKLRLQTVKGHKFDKHVVYMEDELELKPWSKQRQI